MSRKKLVFGVIVAIVLLAVCISAQMSGRSDWEKKPVDQWTEADVKSILQNSPWSLHLEGRWGEPTFMGTIQQDPHAFVVLRSALPVRLALVRKRQLAEKYDSMDPKAKAAFNSKYRSLLECSHCEKFYIVAVAGDSAILQNPAKVRRRADNIYLSNETGERRTLANYTPQTFSGSEALLFFPRNNEKGEPLLRPGNLTLTLNFKNEPGDDAVVRLIERVNVKVQDLVREQTVVF